jgi:hypothetical protein
MIMRQSVNVTVMGSVLSLLVLGALSHRVFAAEDCCTPEATATIAAKAGFVDVVGIKLGMPVRDAVAAIKKHNQRLQVSTPNPFRFNSLPNVTFAGNVTAQVMDGSSHETIQMYVTMPPNQDVVWYVQRTIEFDRNSRPSESNVLASLRQKYGPEHGRMDPINTQPLSQLYWMFDANGKPVPEQQAKQIVSRCMLTNSQSDVAELRQSSPKTWIDNNVNCGEVTMVTANGNLTVPGSGTPGSVLRLLVTAYNGLLHRSAFEASHAMIWQAEKHQADKEQQKMEQVKPVL